MTDLNMSQRAALSALLTAAAAGNNLYVQPGKHDLPKGMRCTACLRLENHAPSCQPPRGLAPSEPEPSDLCRWCRLTQDGGPRTGPWLLDEDGVDVAVSKERRGLHWGHAWDDGFWPCDAAEFFPEPAEVVRCMDEDRKKRGVTT